MALVRTLGWMAATAALGADFTALPRQGPVSDYTRQLDPVSRRQCDALLEAHRAAGRARISIAFLSGTGREPLPSVAESMRRAWNEDVLLLIASGEQRAAVAFRPDLAIDEDEVIHRVSSALLAKSASNEGRAALAGAEALIAATGGKPAPSAPRNPLRFTAWVVLAAAAALLVTRRARAENSWRAGCLFRSGRGGFGGIRS